MVVTEALSSSRMNVVFLLRASGLSLGRLGRFQERALIVGGFQGRIWQAQGLPFDWRKVCLSATFQVLYLLILTSSL